MTPSARGLGRLIATPGGLDVFQITYSNLVFGEWDRIFRDQMATAAAIDRLIHHSVLLEFDVLSFRAEEAEGRKRKKAGQSVTATT